MFVECCWCSSSENLRQDKIYSNFNLGRIGEVTLLLKWKVLIAAAAFYPVVYETNLFKWVGGSCCFMGSFWLIIGFWQKGKANQVENELLNLLVWQESM